MISFGGLPGTGKSTIALAVAERLGATYLRIDTIEQAIRDARPGAIGPEGYMVACALAETNLRLGRLVIADSVNPWPETRQGFRDAAARAGVSVLEVECVCADPTEHRRRVETRSATVAGLKLPSWDDVVKRDYRAWPEPHLVLNTAMLNAEAACVMVCGAVETKKGA